jgi:hypothetical protein
MHRKSILVLVSAHQIPRIGHSSPVSRLPLELFRIILSMLVPKSVLCTECEGSKDVCPACELCAHCWIDVGENCDVCNIDESDHFNCGACGLCTHCDDVKLRNCQCDRHCWHNGTTCSDCSYLCADDKCANCVHCFDFCQDCEFCSDCRALCKGCDRCVQCLKQELCEYCECCPTCCEGCAEKREKERIEVDTKMQEMYPRMPQPMRSTIYEHAWKHGSGRIGEATDVPLETKIQYATEYHVLFTDTDYSQEYEAELDVLQTKRDEDLEIPHIEPKWVYQDYEADKDELKRGYRDKFFPVAKEIIKQRYMPL